MGLVWLWFHCILHTMKRPVGAVAAAPAQAALILIIDLRNNVCEVVWKMQRGSATGKFKTENKNLNLNFFEHVLNKLIPPPDRTWAGPQQRRTPGGFAVAQPHAERQGPRAPPERRGRRLDRPAPRSRQQPSHSGGAHHHQPAADAQAWHLRPGVEVRTRRRESNHRLFCQIP